MMLQQRMPHDVTAQAGRLYERDHKAWLLDQGSFPLALLLGKMTEREFMTGQVQAQSWLGAWRSWRGAGQVVMREYRWPMAGRQVLPEKLVLASPAEVAALAGVQDSWSTVVTRLADLQALVSDGATRAPALVRLADLVLGYAPADWDKMQQCLAYFLSNQNQAMYVRQLPIQGVDTKWVGAHENDLTRLMKALTGIEDGDFHTLCRVQRKPHRVRLKLLDPVLRAQVGGLADLEIPLADLVNGPLKPQRLLLIENEEPGLALTDMAGTMAVVGMGYGVSALQRVDWMRSLPSLYWGDIDTDGLLIHACAQRALPRLKPVMMNLATLSTYRQWCVPEPKQKLNATGLAPEQQVLFDALTRPGPWQGLRLEQERIPWNQACEQIRGAWNTTAQPRPARAPIDAPRDFRFSLQA